MRSLLTRTAQHKKGHRLTPVAFAILAVAIYVVFFGQARAAVRAPADNIITGAVPSAKNHNQYLRHTPKGTEGLELAARLRIDGGYIKRAVKWTVFKRDRDLGTTGKQVFSAKLPIADMVLAPGEYRIEAEYGYARQSRNVSILPKTRLAVTFIMNVGGIRSLSRVSGVDPSNYSSARHTIFALPDRGPARLIAQDIRQGQIVRLAAGSYRIESRFEKGNTLAIANVTVKPGILTSLNIDHQAAFARLTLRTNGNQKVNWSILSHNGRWTKTGSVTRTSLILAPGSYTFSARIGNKSFTRTISLAQGKATTVILGK
jgi:hypothetical protein